MGKGALPRCINSSIRNMPVATHVEPHDLRRKGPTKIIESKSRPCTDTPTIAPSGRERCPKAPELRQGRAHSRRSSLGAPAGSGAFSRAPAGARRGSAHRPGLHQ